MERSKAVIAGLIVVTALGAGGVLAIAHGPRQAPVTAPTMTQGPAADRAEAALAANEAHVPPPMTFTPVFEPCAHCHEIGEGARMSTGPVLNGVVGRKAASRDDYPYSQAMKDSGIVWTTANLRAFLQSPGTLVPGTRMMIGGISEDKIGPLIAFLKTTPER